MTLTQAKKLCAQIGCVLTKPDRFEEEYRVNFKGGSECSAYYTNDLNDAVSTARAMAGKPDPQAHEANAITVEG